MHFPGEDSIRSRAQSKWEDEYFRDHYANCPLNDKANMLNGSGKCTCNDLDTEYFGDDGGY